MPELPEVEAARKLAQEHCAGKKITKVVCEDDETVIQDVKPDELAHELTGRVVKDVHRKGKSLWFEMGDDGPWPSFHFGMTGSFAVRGVESVKYRSVAPSDPEQWPPRFHKVVISFDDGVELAFCDARRFARVRYLEDVTLKSPLSDLGFDAYTELPEPEPFHTSLTKRRAAIKAVLLDQGFLAGIGNWVADEVLYHAGVHPESLAADLEKEATRALRESIRMVLDIAVAANAVSDNYPPDWLFHHRWDVRGSKKEAPKINGHEVAFLKVGGRTSAYLPDLQKRVGGGSGSKPKRAPKSKAGAEGSKAGGRRGAAAKRKRGRKREEDWDSDMDDSDVNSIGDASEPEADAVAKPVAKPAVKRASKRAAKESRGEEETPAEGVGEPADKAAAEPATGKEATEASAEEAPEGLGEKPTAKGKEADEAGGEEAKDDEGRGMKRKVAVEAVVEKAVPAKRGRAKRGGAGAMADEGAPVVEEGALAKGRAGKGAQEAIEKEEAPKEAAEKDLDGQPLGKQGLEEEAPETAEAPGKWVLEGQVGEPGKGKLEEAPKKASLEDGAPEKSVLGDGALDEGVEEEEAPERKEEVAVEKVAPAKKGRAGKGARQGTRSKKEPEEEKTEGRKEKGQRKGKGSQQASGGRWGLEVGRRQKRPVSTSQKSREAMKRQL